MSVLKFERPKKKTKTEILEVGYITIDQLGGVHIEGFRFTEGSTREEIKEVIADRIKTTLDNMC